MIVTNIPLFKGGRANPWADAEDKYISLRDAEGTAIKRKDMENTFQEQSYSDGLLEISVSKSMTNLILDKSRRLGQAGGPFEIKLSDDDADETDRIHFVQIDGEYLKIKNLASITFRLAQDIPDGSLNFLRRNKPNKE